MNNKLFCNPMLRPRKTDAVRCAALGLLALLFYPQARGSGNAPQWMHALSSVTVPSYDDKTNAVLLFSETILNVQGNGKIKITRRRAYKILRPAGRELETVAQSFSPDSKITAMRAWCIPQQGKDYEVKESEAVDVALSGVEFSELVNDTRLRVLRIPAADPGNIIGYEIEQEDRPYVMQETWGFQEELPAREFPFHPATSHWLGVQSGMGQSPRVATRWPAQQPVAVDPDRYSCDSR